MRTELTGWGRAIVVTIALTSAVCMALSAWWFRGQDDGGRAHTLAATGEAESGYGTGFLSGLAGSPSKRIAHRRTPVVSAQGRRSPLLVPVSGVAPADLTDTFTQARASGARQHDAIDIPAAQGTPVLAAAAGKVEKLFVSQDGGNTIYVRSPDRRRIYYYAHLQGYAPGLREGAAVRRGQALGSVGHTGNASEEAPHLHFAVWDADPVLDWYQHGRPVNPYPLLVPRR